MGEAAALTAITASSGIAGAASAISAGRANRDAMRTNAALQRVQAEQELQAAGQQEAVVDARTMLRQGQERAQQAAGGVVVGAGTAGAQLASTEAVGQMDKTMIQINANRRAWGHDATAAIDEYQADLAFKRGQQEAIAGLLDTGARASLEYYRTKRVSGSASNYDDDGDVTHG